MYDSDDKPYAAKITAEYNKELYIKELSLSGTSYTINETDGEIVIVTN